MTKFLFGRTTVEVVEASGASPEEAQQDANKKFAEKTDKGEPIHTTTYIFCWCEGGVMDTHVERNRALAAYLELLTKVIPFTPSQKGLIVLDGGIKPQQHINILRQLPAKPGSGLPGDRPSPRIG